MDYMAKGRVKKLPFFRTPFLSIMFIRQIYLFSCVSHAGVNRIPFRCALFCYFIINAAPSSYAFRHSCGNTSSCLLCFSSGSNSVHCQSVLL